MHLFRRRPSAERLTAILAESADAPWTYAAVGGTRDLPPRRYVLDRNQQRLGRGRDTFDAARDALQRWSQFDLGWVELHPTDAPIAEGSVVGVLAKVFGFHLFNPCRIVYTVDEENARGARFGFAYGTLPGHAARGEERFQIVWNRVTGEVRYEVLAFSQPALALAIGFYPMVRHLQRRFGRDTRRAMLRETERSRLELTGSEGARGVHRR